MKSMTLTSPGGIESRPLTLSSPEIPRPAPHELLVRVHVCGICHTDLHIVEADLPLPRLPVIPGHQVVGSVERAGSAVTMFRAGDRVGVPWLFATCGTCEQCRAGKENLCDNIRFTGYSVDGGYAEYMTVSEEFAYAIPENFSDAQAAPLLCAGVIGYRALRLSSVAPGQRLALYGFGASAHIALQIAVAQGCEVYVFTRSDNHRRLAEELGARWTGSAGHKAPHPVSGAVIFAPAGSLVPAALGAVGKGGTVVLAGIHMSPIPEMPYRLMYDERVLRSVANSTRQDVRELLDVAARTGIVTTVETFRLEDANEALHALKESRIRGSAALLIR